MLHSLRSLRLRTIIEFVISNRLHCKRKKVVGMPKTPPLEAMPTDCDVLVIGSGAGGLSTAVTAAHHGLNVVVLEKTPLVGGTTALSGGWMWIPRNPLAIRAGIVESPEEPLKYLVNEIGTIAHDPRMTSFLENGPKMVDFFEKNTAVQFIDGNAVPDFHMSDGSANGGRSICAAPFDGRALGAFAHHLRLPLHIVTLWGMGIAAGKDLNHFMSATRNLRSAMYVAKRLLRHAYDKVMHGRTMQLVNGNALAARLLKSAIDLDVQIQTNSTVIKLINEDDRICGAVVEQAGETKRIIAKVGVVLATGGYPHDHQRIGASLDHFPKGEGHFTVAPDSNTGDGLRLGEAVGGFVTNCTKDACAWSPVSLVPLTNGDVGRFPHLIGRAKPGFIAVDRHAKRFANEANSYHDFIAALLAATPAGEEVSAWLICDHPAQRRYGLGWARPFPFPLRKAVRNGYVKKGRTLGELARVCGLDGGTLEETVRSFNKFAELGTDPAFGRGLSRFNQVQGDLTHQPNPALGPLQKGPYYAVKIVAGSLGTFSGLETNGKGEVLMANSQAISGLYAVGNDMASILQGHYPSGGITLGPAMTFGYIIGNELAKRSAQSGA